MTNYSRRDFLKFTGALAASTLIPSGNVFANILAASSTDGFRALTIGYRNIEVNKRSAKVYGLTNEAGKSGLIFKKGERFKVRLQNNTNESTLVHWHGITPPWKYDGVPNISQPPLDAGKSYDYDFELARTGTNWMHAHTLQEQSLLAAPLIIQDDTSTQEIVMMLHDFSFKSPEEILAELKSKKMPEGEAMKMDMHMSKSDIEYDAYLTNDRTLDDPEIVQVEAGSKVRLRVINGATSTNFTISLGEISGELIAVDGIDIIPVKGNNFPISMAQRLDILVSIPNQKKSFPILALREGAVEQTGIILAASGTQIAKIATRSEVTSPTLTLDFEKTLISKEPIANPEKEPDIHAHYNLEGTMIPYSWNLIRLDKDQPNELFVKEGQRVKISFKNASMMSHPIHLHGHHFQVVALDDEPLKDGAVRDTLLLPPHASADIIFDANNKGKWPLHCHHLYHMVSGMMTFVVYDGIA